MVSGDQAFLPALTFYLVFSSSFLCSYFALRLYTKSQTLLVPAPVKATSTSREIVHVLICKNAVFWNVTLCGSC
jgi:hypothetical protein